MEEKNLEQLDENTAVVSDGENTEEMKLKITPATVARTVIFFLGIVNQILTRCGKPIIPVGNEIITEVISDIWIIVSGLVAWWKNNSFSKAALAGDLMMRLIRKADREKES